jgi:hypothetical protein
MTESRPCESKPAPGASKTLKQPWIRSISYRRLEYTLPIFDSELQSVIETANSQGHNAGSLHWQKRAQELHCKAKSALQAKNPELGWRCLKAASRWLLYGLAPDELQAKASSILREGIDEKMPQGWRKQNITELLTDPEGRLKPPQVQDVVEAAKILHDHQDNIYEKLSINRGRLRLLAIAAAVVVGLWIVVLRPLPGDWAKISSNQSVDPLMFWLTVVLASLVGAIISGFISSMKRGEEKTRIPLELAESTVTYARLSLAALSSIAVFVFLSSGILKPGNPSFELALAIALAAGFSERLVLRGVESLSRTSGEAPQPDMNAPMPPRHAAPSARTVANTQTPGRRAGDQAERGRASQDDAT